MPTPGPTRFQSWEFTEQENRSASILNDLQKKKIQTIQCQIAEQLLNIEAAAPDQIAAAEIQRAYLNGQIKILGLLLETSDSMEIQVNTDEYIRQEEAQQMQDPIGPNLYTHFMSPKE